MLVIDMLVLEYQFRHEYTRISSQQPDWTALESKFVVFHKHDPCGSLLKRSHRMHSKIQSGHFIYGARERLWWSVLFRSVNYDMVNTNRHCANNSYICLSASKHDICSIIVKIKKFSFLSFFGSRDHIGPLWRWE